MKDEPQDAFEAIELAKPKDFKVMLFTLRQELNYYRRAERALLKKMNRCLDKRRKEGKK